jgi:hypothetical protein
VSFFRGFPTSIILSHFFLVVLLNPRVVLDLVKSVALVRVKGQDILDEMAHFGREVLWKLQIDVLDALVRLIIVMRLEGRETATKFKT